MTMNSSREESTTTTTNVSQPHNILDQDFFGNEMRVALTVLGTVILVLDLIGNGTVIHIVRTRTHMRNTTNLLIANLAAADLLMVGVVAFLTKHLFVGFRWPGGMMGTISCKLILSCQPLSVMASVLTVSVISVDRYFAVMFPLRRFFGIKRIVKLVAAIWVISVAFSVPVAVVSDSVEIGDKFYCFEYWKAASLSKQSFVISFTTLGYVIPLGGIATLYLTMGVKLWRSSAPGHHTADIQHKIKSGRRKATKMLITVVTVFALCWLPLHVAEMLRLFANKIYWSIPFKLNWLLPFFGIANSITNPFIYVVFCEKFRREFIKILWPIKLSMFRSEMQGAVNGNPKYFVSLKSYASTEFSTRRSITTTM